MSDYGKYLLPHFSQDPIVRRVPRVKADVPLIKAVNSFHGYRKGPFAMYALREYIGEDQVNAALKNLLNKFASGEPPYATALDFYKEIKHVTPDSLHYLLKDLFEKTPIGHFRPGR